MSARTAACSCGQLTASVEGDPIRVSVCHCLACQRRTGSVFGAQARFGKSNIEIKGESKQYIRIGDAGTGITFNFCPDCGATVFYTLETQEDLIAIPVGVFADPTFPRPTRSVYESRKHAWVTLPQDVEHLD